jgi:hypothetical protein
MALSNRIHIQLIGDFTATDAESLEQWLDFYA